MTESNKCPTPTSNKVLAVKKSPTPKLSKSPEPVSKVDGKLEVKEKERKKIGRGRRPGVINKKSLDAIGQDSPQEFSEPEARASRPSRKTKEAATIYMELIGRKLSLKELSDDDSLDSLELPNIQRMQQMEDEIKSSHEKQVELAARQASSPSIGTPKVNEEDPKDEPTKKKRGRKKKEVVPVPVVVEPEVVEVEPEKVENKIETPVLKPLEKSFSDSDEEPLAIKAKTNKKETTKRGRKTSTPNKKDIPVVEIKVPEIAVEKTPSPVKLSKWQERLLANSSPKSKTTVSPVAQKLFETSPTKDVLNKTDDSLKVHNRSSNAGVRVFSPDSKTGLGQKPSTSETDPKDKPFVRPSKVENIVATEEIIDDDDEEVQQPLNLAPKSLLGNLFI